MYQVQKRDGKVTDFDISKITAAISKAFDALEKQYHPSTIDLLALNVTAHFEPKIKSGIIDVEDIQDSVEEVLSTAGYADVAKSYILYRRQREKVRNANATLLDYKDLVDQYVKVEDILDVALALFFEKGYDNTSIQDIIDGLGGLTKGAVYHHFKSKEDILSAALDRENAGLYQETPPASATTAA